MHVFYQGVYCATYVPSGELCLCLWREYLFVGFFNVVRGQDQGFRLCNEALALFIAAHSGSRVVDR